MAILGRPLHLIDHEKLARPFGRFEFQPDLLQCCGAAKTSLCSDQNRCRQNPVSDSHLVYSVYISAALFAHCHDFISSMNASTCAIASPPFGHL